jgi:FixJ family two-component response regulator
MPEGVTGIKIVEMFRQDRPSLPVIFASGYDLGNFETQELPAGARFIQKPFDANDFLKLVQTALEKM